MAEDLVASLDGILGRAVGQASSAAARDRLVQARSRLQGPLRVAIAGKLKTGKSTLLNAIIGEELAATDAGECTKVVSWYGWGDTPQVSVHPVGRPPVPRPWSRASGALVVDLGGLSVAEVDRIEVAWPTGRLRHLTLLDTPGIASISADISQRTESVMSADQGRVPVADAVLYLLRFVHPADVGFLEAFHDALSRRRTPVNSIGVLSRADEIGSCELNAMEVADRIARRYEDDPRLRRLCPIVVPVDGLLAHSSVTLQEREFTLLSRIARAGRSEVEQLLLTADRFLARTTSIRMTADERILLLDRFGLFGVRLSVHLIADQGVDTASELAIQLAQRSGLVRLRSALLKQFDRRSRVLRARSALLELHEILGSDGFGDRTALLAELEALYASTNAFAEVDLLSALHAGEVDLKQSRLEILDRLMGSKGDDPQSRLGLRPEASESEIREAALTALQVWQRAAEHPLSSSQARAAARVAIRTLEGLMSDALDDAALHQPLHRHEWG
jgi:hypothetical protein